METKICSKCNLEKFYEDFAWRNKSKNLKTSECKLCHKIIRDSYYRKNKTKETGPLQTAKRGD